MSARAYSLLLSFYPAELRRDFGAEMTEVFLEDLEDARRHHGVIGVAQVWWRSVQEVCRIAAPELVSRREIAVPLVAFAFQALYMSSMFALVHSDPLSPAPKTAGETLTVIFGTSLFPAVIARVVVCVCDRSIPVPLKLGLL